MNSSEKNTMKTSHTLEPLEGRQFLSAQFVPAHRVPPPEREWGIRAPGLCGPMMAAVDAAPMVAKKSLIHRALVATARGNVEQQVMASAEVRAGNPVHPGRPHDAPIDQINQLNGDVQRPLVALMPDGSVVVMRFRPVQERRGQPADTTGQAVPSPTTMGGAVTTASVAEADTAAVPQPSAFSQAPPVRTPLVRDVPVPMRAPSPNVAPLPAGGDGVLNQSVGGLSGSNASVFAMNPARASNSRLAIVLTAIGDGSTAGLAGKGLTQLAPAAMASQAVLPWMGGGSMEATAIAPQVTLIESIATVPASAVYHIARIDLLGSFADAIGSMTDDFLAMGSDAGASADGSLVSPARAWNITTAVIAADVALLSFLYWRSKRRRKPQAFGLRGAFSARPIV